MNEDFVGEPVLPTAALLRFFLRDDRRHPMYQVSGVGLINFSNDAYELSLRESDYPKEF